MPDLLTNFTRIFMRSSDGDSLRRLSAIPFVYGIVLLCCLLWNWVVGKDLNWDFVNYHLYIGRSAFEPRWGQDFFPASIQSYLNPYAYVPLAAMVSWGWRDIAIGSVLAALHAVNLLLIWLISERSLSAQLKFARCWRWIAVLLAALSPVFLQQVGGSFADITTATPALLALYLLLRMQGNWQADRSLILSAGTALGVAIGFKLSNAPFVIGLLGAVALTYGVTYTDRLKTVVCISLAAAGGLIAVHGYWGWRLFQEFGNPFFPFLNDWFRSPDYPAVGIKHVRFLQDSLWSSIGYLFRMALPDREVYIEPGSPDVRVAVAFLLLIALSATQLAARWIPAAARRWALAPNEKLLVLTFTLSGAIWLATTANGRYATTILLLAGPVTVWLWLKVVPSVRWSTYGIGAVVLVQLVSVALGADRRWNPHPWSGEWLNLRVPSRFVEQPALFLSMDTQSYAFLSAHVHPKSGFANITGQYVLGPGAPGYRRLEKLLSENQNRVYMLVGLRLINLEGLPVPTLEDYVGKAARLGFEIVNDDCYVTAVREGIDKLTYMKQSGKDAEAIQEAALAKSGKGFILACRLQPLEAEKRMAYEAKVAAFDPIFNRIEDMCPNLFRPRRPVTEAEDDYAVRKYVDTDVWLWVHGDAVFYRGGLGDLTVNFGKRSELMRTPAPPVDCKLKTGRSFSKEQMEQLRNIFE
jgi:hypothetical protein